MNDVKKKPQPQILLVEDTPVIQQATMQILDSLDCSIDLAENGLEAIQLFISHKYDLVFLDIGLPDISGVDVAKTLRMLKNNKGVPMLALTTSDEGIIPVCLEAGINEVLKKPVSRDGFVAILQRWLQ